MQQREHTEDGGVLIGQAGMYADTAIPISKGEQLVIGRDVALAHIVVDTSAEKVSRKHCTVSYIGPRDGFMVTDWSTNGTWASCAAGDSRLPARVSCKVPCGTTIWLGNQSNGFLLAGY